MEGTEFYDFKSCLLSNRLHVNKTVQRFSDDFWGEAARGKKKTTTQMWTVGWNIHFLGGSWKGVPR